MDAKEILSVFLILFSVIDIPGNVPIIISLKEKGKIIKPIYATVVAGSLMILFLFIGESLLNLFGIDVQSFAIAGAIILFIIAMEMVLGVTLFKETETDEDDDSTSIVPVAFPLIAGESWIHKENYHQHSSPLKNLLKIETNHLDIY